MKSAPNIAFDVAPSRTLAGISLIIIVLAVGAVLLSGLPVAAKFLLGIVTIASGAHALRRFLRPDYRRIARTVSGWVLVDQDGDDVPATLLGHSRLGVLLVLDLAPARRRRFRCVLTPDVIDADLRRRLLLVLAAEPGNVDKRPGPVDD